MAGFHVRQTQPSGLSRSSRQRAEEGRACSLGRSLILKTCRHLLESFQQWGACHLPRLPVSWKASLCRQFHSSWEAGTSCPGAFALAVSSAATWNEPGPFPGRGPCSFLRAACVLTPSLLPPTNASASCQMPGRAPGSRRRFWALVLGHIMRCGASDSREV